MERRLKLARRLLNPENSVLIVTIDEKKYLHLILDEAHRDMKPDRERATIVQKLINGHSGTPAVPSVLGISATVERFNQATKRRSSGAT